ncbi:MAG: FMN-binding protein [Halieaceae bacterium]|jgi:Na+-translocating ferredoxin:NAD+ oxidoreductase subunit G|nr:FMN-binding protein [Halieaceae bacterium]
MSDESVTEESIEPQADSEPVATEVSTFRLVATLAVAGTLAGLLIVMMNQHTKPIIDKYKAEQLRKAVYEVLPGVDRYSTLYLVNEALSLTLPEGVKESEYKRIYAGYGGDGQLGGVAISRGESGFQDVVQIIFGFDPETGKLLGMKVLDSKETPGLGDKIFKDQSFVEQFFARPDTPLLGVKPGAGKGLSNEIDTITGATISSKVVIDIINHGLEIWRPVIDKGIPSVPSESADVEVTP